MCRINVSSGFLPLELLGCAKLREISFLECKSVEISPVLGELPALQTCVSFPTHCSMKFLCLMSCPHLSSCASQVQSAKREYQQRLIAAQGRVLLGGPVNSPAKGSDSWRDVSTGGS